MLVSSRMKHLRSSCHLLPNPGWWMQDGGWSPTVRLPAARVMDGQESKDLLHGPLA